MHKIFFDERKHFKSLNYKGCLESEWNWNGILKLIIDAKSEPITV